MMVLQGLKPLIHIKVGRKGVFQTQKERPTGLETKLLEVRYRSRLNFLRKSSRKSLRWR
jgi:hypothetical protein